MTCCAIAYHRGVGRWKPDARERLRTAAIELFSEQGFAATTVPQITERAGLTTRTFYRHFADKRDVLFPHLDAQPETQAALGQTPPGLTTAGFLAWGLSLLASRFEGFRGEMRITRALIDSDPGLQERALRKREMLRSVVDMALRDRGLDTDQAGLLADATVGALYTALDKWLQSDGEVRVDTVAVDALAALRSNLEGIDGAH
jgi:AcrR family transcriptional regulator